MMSKAVRRGHSTQPGANNQHPDGAFSFHVEQFMCHRMRQRAKVKIHELSRQSGTPLVHTAWSSVQVEYARFHAVFNRA